MLDTAVLVIYSHSQSAGAALSQERDLRNQWLKYTLSTEDGGTTQLPKILTFCAKIGNSSHADDTVRVISKDIFAICRKVAALHQTHRKVA